LADKPDESASPARSPIEEAQRLFRQSESLAEHPDAARYVEANKAFIAYVEAHRRALDADGAETAGRLDRVGVVLYRHSELDLAARATDLGLGFAPGSATLLHHKAMVLLALNKSLEQVLPLLESALAANPHDKQIWGTKGDALRVLDRPAEAAEAYVKAQQLDATSSQYVDKALKVAPTHPVALRMKLQLARAHGGDKQALEACEALLAANPEDGALLVARAELLTTLGEVERALDALGPAEKARPEDPKIHLLRGRLLLATGKAAEAAAEFQTLLGAKSPLDAVALGEVAEALDAAGNPSASIDARQRLKEVEPRNIGNLTALRAIATREGRTDVALDAAKAVLESSPDNLEAMRAIAELYASAGRHDEAVDAYRALLAAHPTEPGEARRAVAFARTAGLLEVLVEFGKVALAAEPEDAATQSEVAEALTTLGDKEGALAAVDAVLQSRPQDAAALAQKKQLLTELGRVDELASVFDELFRLDPTRSDIALERAHLYLARAFDQPEGSPDRDGAAREALVSYERASLDPEMAGRSLLGVARASRLVRDHERAIRAYRDFLAIPANTQRADVLKELGHALRETGRLSEAEAVYAQAVQLGLEDPDLFWAESEVLSLLNQDARALRLIELLLEREPGNPLFLRRKGALLLKAGRRAEALQVLKTAVIGAEGDPHVQFEVAEALRATGVYADAVAYFKAGLEVDPKNRPARLALAETLGLAGRHNEAIPILDALLREDPNDVSCWRARADAYRRLQRPNDLLYSLKAILLLDPHNGPALLEKYHLHVERKDLGEAYECLSMLVDSGGTEAGNAALLLEHGDLSASLGHTEEANRSFERAAQLDPGKSVDIAVRRARLRLGAGRPDLALESLDAAIQGAPPSSSPNVPALLLRAEILAALERPTEASQVYEQVRQLEPTSVPALAGMARSMLDQGQPGEAKTLLSAAGPGPLDPRLVLLLAEAEAGEGSLPNAITVVQKGTEAFPRAGPLWVRLGELFIAREGWADAANALAHAIAIDPSDPHLPLRAGYVAERLGHPNEALALYDRATQIAPSDKNAWCSRGVALLATGRPEDALQSFERALGLDSDFEPAKEGKKAALQKTREAQVEKYGREALLLEAKLHRTVTKNDLFVTLHVPFDLLEPVLSSLARNPTIRLDRLSESEMHDLESASYHLISTALDRRPEGIERRGFTLADVAVLSPASASLDQVQRLFGYVRAVLEADLRPENLQLTPDVEELARRALLLPESQRTLFQLVRTLQVGLFKARLIKAVEQSGTAGHAQVPALDLGKYSPEFRRPAEGTPTSGDLFFAPENVPAPLPSVGGGLGATEPHHRPHTAPLPESSPSGPLPRCVGCGGIASIHHECGAALCQHCTAQFHTCPKCGRPITPTSSRAIAAPAPTPAHSARPPHPPEPAAHPHVAKPVPARPKPIPPKAPSASVRPAHPGDKPRAPPAPPASHPPPEADEPEEEPTATPPPPRPTRVREKPDDEPRL
jgi:tetratricopeptide (TPR) repeat protein